MDKIKVYLPYAILIGALILVYSVVVRSCDLTDSYSVALGEYKSKAAAAKILTAEIKRENAGLVADIALKSGEIVTLEKKVAEKNANIAVIDTKLKQKEKDLAGAKTDAERVPILTDLVAGWTAKYNEAQGIIADKDKQISTWASKYNDLEKISQNYLTGWNDAEGRVIALEKLKGKLETDLRVARIGSKVKSVIVLAAGGVIIASLLKK
jgi:chromosome segregation ATPase